MKLLFAVSVQLLPSLTALEPPEEGFHSNCVTGLGKVCTTGSLPLDLWLFSLQGSPFQSSAILFQIASQSYFKSFSDAGKGSVPELLSEY